MVISLGFQYIKLITYILALRTPIWRDFESLISIHVRALWTNVIFQLKRTAVRNNWRPYYKGKHISAMSSHVTYDFEMSSTVHNINVNQNIYIKIKVVNI